MDIYSTTFEFRFDDVNGDVEIWHPDKKQFARPLIKISCETLAAMTFQEASQFIGERLILLTPPLRSLFEDYFWGGEDGNVPPKLG